jgi:hypothetical protein
LSRACNTQCFQRFLQSSPMEHAKVVEWLDRGLVQFCLDEADLDLEVCERTLCGRVLVHLDSLLRTSFGDWYNDGWRVDTEYDLVGTLFLKRLPELDEVLDALAAELHWPPERIPRGSSDRVYPDLILHKRKSGFVEGNEVVCELKRTDDSIERIARDVGKLIDFQRRLNYKHAVLILLAKERASCSILPVGVSAEDGANVLRVITEARTHGQAPIL